MGFLRPHYSDCSSSSRWSAMEYRHCQPPCTHSIADDNLHRNCVKCMGFSHARKTIYGISNISVSKFFALDSRFLREVHPFFSPAVTAVSDSEDFGLALANALPPSSLTNTAAADFTNLEGSVEQGFTAIPVSKETLASYLSPFLSLRGNPAPSFQPNHVGSLLPLSGSPTLQLARQAVYA